MFILRHLSPEFRVICRLSLRLLLLVSLEPRTPYPPPCRVHLGLLQELTHLTFRFLSLSETIVYSRRPWVEFFLVGFDLVRPFRPGQRPETQVHYPTTLPG